MYLAMAFLKERLRPFPQAEPPRAARKGDGDLLWMRYTDLVKLGYSPETSMIVAEAPVPLDAVTSLLRPDQL